MIFRRSPLSCRELVELVTDYLEETLSPRDRARFETHIAGCAGCDAYLVQMRRTLLVVGSIEPEAVPPATMAALLDAFRGWAN